MRSAKFLWTAIVGGVLLMLAVYRRDDLGARLVLNAAKVTLLHPDDWAQDQVRTAVVSASSLAVKDSHLRSQLADSLARLGDCGTAVATLLNLQRDLNGLDPLDARLLSICQSYIGDQAGAYATVKRYGVGELLTEDAAARILWHLEKSSVDHEREHVAVRDLVQTAYGLHGKTGARSVASLVEHTGFWRSAQNLGIIENLRWRANFPRDVGRSDGLVPMSEGEFQVLIARHLSTDPSNVVLGRNLVPNSGLEQLDLVTRMPRWWTPVYMATGEPWNVGYFSVAVDADTRDNTIARIDGLSIETLPSRELGRAGFAVVPIRLAAGRLYAVALDYCTLQTNPDAVRVFLSTNQAIFPPIERVLSSSETWRRMVIVFRNNSLESEMVYPAVRLFSTGTAWFDNFSIREVTLHDPISLPDEGYVEMSEAVGGQ